MMRDLEALSGWVRRSCAATSKRWVARWAIVSTIGAAGCASSPPERTPGVVEIGATSATAASSATAIGSARVTAPPASCVVQGTKLPFASCDALNLRVNEVGPDAPAVAYVRDDADVKITFGGEPFRAEIVATSGRYRARGRLDAAGMWLPLLRPIDAARGHVKVFAGAPVRVRQVRGDDVDVDVWMGFGELDTITAKAACKDLAFAPVELARIDTTPQGPNAVVYQPKGVLSLLDAPEGKELMRVAPREPGPTDLFPPRARPGIPRAANLAVLERRNGFARITFEGTFVAIDAWVREGEIAPGTAQGFGGGYGCGRGASAPKGKKTRVTRDTLLSLGESGGAAKLVDVEALQGAEVWASTKEGDRVRIDAPPDAIQPPHPLSYWIDANALE